MGSLGAKFFTLELETSNDNLPSPQDAGGSNYGNFTEAFRDDSNSTVPAADATESRITYAFENSFSIREMQVIADSDAAVEGHLYMIFAPGDPNINREFVTSVPLNVLARTPFLITLDPPYFLEDVSDKLKVRFTFKGHGVGAQLKYYVNINGEEFTSA